MPFREKVKKAFGAKNGSSSSGPSSPPKRKDIEYYKPGKIPSSKYRGPWDQKHQDKLHAFSFEDAFRDRQNSIPPTESPRGTLAQSRRSSWMSRARSSLGGRSESAEDRLGVRRQSHVRHVEKLAEEGDGDADTGNVGPSRPSAIEQANSGQANKLQMEKTISQPDSKQGGGANLSRQRT